MGLTLEDLENQRLKIKKDTEELLTPLVNRIDKVESAVSMLQRMSKEKNIIIHGIPESRPEPLETLINTVDGLWQSIGVTEILVDNVYRIGRAQADMDRPIIVKLVRTLDKRRIFKGAWDKQLYKEKIFINDDLTKEQQGEQKLLREYLKAAKQTDKAISGKIRGNSLQLRRAGVTFKNVRAQDGSVMDN